jgi:DNA polymerase III subunit epsilon
MSNSKTWNEYTYVAFDTETSGAYPLAADIVEIGLLKYQDGKVIDEYQTLLKPKKPMTDFIIGIHGITNEMVADAPLIEDKILEIKNFIGDSVLLAHHAPFDLGFLVAEFEKYKITLPDSPLLCTSLLSRKLINESPNHKLQTLIPILNLPAGQAHRALDDARACLYLGLECFKRASKNGEEATLEQLSQIMGKKLEWGSYLLQKKHSPIFQIVVDAIMKSKDLDIIYAKGTVKNKSRRITPIGIVRNPDGDYIMAQCHIDHAQKRFYLREITDAQIVW